MLHRNSRASRKVHFLIYMIQKKRLFLYVGATMVGGTLAYAGWFHHPEADVATLAACAEGEMSLGLFESAVGKAERALARDPGNLHARLVAAHCYNAQKNHVRAVEYYEMALRHPDVDRDLRAEIQVAIAMDATRREKYSEALALLSDVDGAAATPAFIKLYYVRGIVREKAGNQAGAVADFERAVAEVTDADMALQFDSACRLARAGRTNTAIIALDMLAKNSHPFAPYHAARLKFEMGCADNGIGNLRSLSVISRKALAKDIANDAPFWENARNRGLLPPDLAAWLLPAKQDS